MLNHNIFRILPPILFLCMGASAVSVTGDTNLLELSYFPHFTCLQSANMFTQCHGAYLRSCFLVYLMAGMLAQRVSPMRVMTTIKTVAFWWPSRSLGRRGVVVPCWTPWFRVVWRLSAAPKLFCNRNSSSRPDLMGLTDGGHVMW